MYSFSPFTLCWDLLLRDDIIRLTTTYLSYIKWLEGRKDNYLYPSKEDSMYICNCSYLHFVTWSWLVFLTSFLHEAGHISFVLHHHLNMMLLCKDEWFCQWGVWATNGSSCNLLLTSATIKENTKGFPGGSGVKNAPAMQETQDTWVWSLGWEELLEEGMAACSSILAWKIP